MLISTHKSHDSDGESKDNATAAAPSVDTRGNPHHHKAGYTSTMTEEEDMDDKEAPIIVPPPLAPQPPAWISWLVPRCWCCHFPNAPLEATGLSIDFFARGHILMSSLFLGPALLELAQAAASLQSDCTDNNNTSANQEEEEDEDSSFCKIYGFRPSSLLSNIAIVSGILGSLAMPFVGAVVDHTHHRKAVAAASAIALATIKGIEVMVGPHTWLLVASLQVVSGILYNVHATAAYAYTSELSSDPTEQGHYNASYNALLYGSMLLFLLEILGLSAVLGTDDVGTARLSQVVTSSTALVCFVVAWHSFFAPRPALSPMPPHSSLWTVGFVKVLNTSRRIVLQYRALSWAILAMMLNESAMAAFATIATTYLKEVLDMTASEIGLVFFLVLVMGIPGSYLGSTISAKLGSPIRSALVCDLAFVLATFVASLLLTGPEHKGEAMLFAAIWGGALGWLGPVDTTIFMNLMPDDSRAEFMGVMMLAGNVLSWLPPLIFSLLNEAGAPMAWGLASLNLFFLLAMGCLLQIGNFAHARLEALSSASPMMIECGNASDAEESSSADDRHVQQGVSLVVNGRECPPLS